MVKAVWITILVLVGASSTGVESRNEPRSTGSETRSPVFTDVTDGAGIRFKHSFGDFDLSNIVEGSGAGAMFFDYNGDGWLDIYFVNGCWLKETSDNHGRILRGKLSNTLYRNNGDGTFTDVTKQAGVGDEEHYGVGCSAADFDNDGDLDLLVVNLNDRARLLRNDGGNRNNWLIVEPKLPAGKTDAIGARVTITTGSLIQLQDMIPVRGYLSQADPRCHFGLGKAIFERIMTNDGRIIPKGNRCATCHFPPLFTDRQQHDIGTKLQYDHESKFDTPHLNNIYDSAPYLHNGIAETLEEIWTRFNPEDKHGVTNDMTKDQLNDLMEYLKTL